MSVPLQPMADYIVAQTEEAANKTASGLYIPGGAQEKPSVAKVVAVAAGVKSVKGWRPDRVQKLQPDRSKSRKRNLPARERGRRTGYGERISCGDYSRNYCVRPGGGVGFSYRYQHRANG
jgi:hypothetical protein